MTRSSLHPKSSSSSQTCRYFFWRCLVANPRSTCITNIHNQVDRVERKNKCNSKYKRQNICFYQSLGSHLTLCLCWGGAVVVRDSQKSCSCQVPLEITILIPISWYFSCEGKIAAITDFHVAHCKHGSTLCRLRSFIS